MRPCVAFVPIFFLDVVAFLSDPFFRLVLTTAYSGYSSSIVE
jgi:hypothetical protein